MKKYILAILLASMAINMCACGNAVTDVAETSVETSNENISEEVSETVEEEPEATQAVLEEKAIDVSWYEQDNSIMLQGVYVVGEDIAAGNYIFTCVSDYADVTVFDNKDAYLNYHKQDRLTVGDDREAREANQKSNEFLYKEDYYALNVTDGNVIMIEQGYGSLAGGSSQVLSVDQMMCNGLYEAGTIPVGQYAIGCAQSEYGGVTFVVFEDANKYADFNAADKFTNGDWRRAEETNAFYSLYLHDGELCYINVKKDTVILVDDQGILNLYSIKPSFDSNMSAKSTESETIDEDEVSEAESGDVTPEFKKAMDEYEAFYDEYCEFMKKYSKADADAALGMMTDYLQMIERLDEMNKKFDEMGKKEMSSADMNYYIDVNARIQKKLLSVME